MLSARSAVHETRFRLNRPVPSSHEAKRLRLEGLAHVGRALPDRRKILQGSHRGVVGGRETEPKALIIRNLGLCGMGLAELGVQAVGKLRNSRNAQSSITSL